MVRDSGLRTEEKSFCPQKAQIVLEWGYWCVLAVAFFHHGFDSGDDEGGNEGDDAKEQ